jgi:hypothetical protein
VAPRARSKTTRSSGWSGRARSFGRRWCAARPATTWTSTGSIRTSVGDTILYRNPFVGLRFSDEEIAISTMIAATAAWARGDGPPPYPLAEGCQDHLIGLAIEESASKGMPVTTSAEHWASTTG